MSLIISCPLKEPLASCLFNKFRDISILKLIENTDSLTEEEILLMAKEHKECFKGRKIALKSSGALEGVKYKRYRQKDFY